MSWPEFVLARLLLAEKRVGAPQRAHDRAELEQDQQGRAILEAQGLVGDGPR